MGAHRQENGTGEGRDSRDPAQGHLELAGGALRDEGPEDAESPEGEPEASDDAPEPAWDADQEEAEEPRP